MFQVPEFSRPFFGMDLKLGKSSLEEIKQHDMLPIELEYKPVPEERAMQNISQSAAVLKFTNPSAHVPNSSANVLRMNPPQSAQVPTVNLLSADVPKGTSSSTDVPQLSVWTKERLPPEMKYGPFKGEIKKEATDPSQAWEIVDNTGKVKGWLDGSHHGNWLRHVRSTDAVSYNLLAIQVQDEVFYETRCWIESGQELLLHREAGLIQEKDLQVRQHSSTEIKRFPCTKCGKYFKSKVALRRHETYVCNNQHAIFSNLNQQFRQQKTNTTTEAVNNKNSNAMQYIRDKEESGPSGHLDHQNSQEYICENCPRESQQQFSSASALQTHISLQHPGARSHACAQCGKTFATASGLKQHAHIHSSVKPFQCHVCSKAYTQFSNLCRHKRMHSDCRRIHLQCPRCLQSFASGTLLAKHQENCDKNDNLTSDLSTSEWPLGPQEESTFQPGSYQSSRRNSFEAPIMPQKSQPESTTTVLNAVSSKLADLPSDDGMVKGSKQESPQGSMHVPSQPLDLRSVKHGNVAMGYHYNTPTALSLKQYRSSPYLPVGHLPHPIYISEMMDVSQLPLLPFFSLACFPPPSLFLPVPLNSQVEKANEALRSSAMPPQTEASTSDKFLCTFCDKTFPRAANLTRHLRTHTGEQPYQCPHCDRLFSISSNLQRHIRNLPCGNEDVMTSSIHDEDIMNHIGFNTDQLRNHTLARDFQFSLF